MSTSKRGYVANPNDIWFVSLATSSNSKVFLITGITSNDAEKKFFFSSCSGLFFEV